MKWRTIALVVGSAAVHGLGCEPKCGASSCVDVADAQSDASPDVLASDAQGDASPDVLASDAADGAMVDGGAAEASAGDASMIDPSIEPPRKVAPMSASVLTASRPSFRWQNPAGVDGAVLELSRTRDFARVERSVRVAASAARLEEALTAGTWFWRTRGWSRVRGVEGTRSSPVWTFSTSCTRESEPTLYPARSAFDFNGDGYPDVATTANNGATRYVQVFYGGPGMLSARPAVQIEVGGLSASSAPIANAGDVNGDGYSDLLIGIDDADGARRNSVGVVRVYFGGATPSPTAAMFIEGAVPSGRFGSDLTSAGDLNGDGYADVVVAARAAMGATVQHIGAAYVHHGSAAGLEQTPAHSFAARAGDLSFGASIAVGDLNGDGRGDLVVSAPQSGTDALSGAGRVLVFDGTASGFSAAPSRTIEGLAARDQLGLHIAISGDADGDGFDDLLVQSSEQNIVTPSGVVSLYAGSSTGVRAAPIRTYRASAATLTFGYAMHGGVDVNRDGRSDFVIGAPLEEDAGGIGMGSVSLYLGGSPVAATPASKWLGSPMLREIGHAVLLSDLNGDGFADLVVGASTASVGGFSQSGALLIFAGGAAGFSATPSQVVGGDRASAALGAQLAQ